MEEVTSSKLEIDSGKHELICPRHKAGGSKGWLIHVIDGFVIEESSVPFQVKSLVEFFGSPPLNLGRSMIGLHDFLCFYLVIVTLLYGFLHSLMLHPLIT